MTVVDEVPVATIETVPIHHHSGMDRLHRMDEAAADTVLHEVKGLSEEMDLQEAIDPEVTALPEVVRGTSFGNEDHLEVVVVVAMEAGTTTATMTASADDQEVRNVVETTVDDDIEVGDGFAVRHPFDSYYISITQSALPSILILMLRSRHIQSPLLRPLF
jgi:hypothetical protein